MMRNRASAKTTLPVESNGRISRVVLVAVLGILLLAALVSGIGMREARQTQHEVISAARDAVSSVEVARRMTDDIDRERLLVGAHIFEPGVVAMAKTEEQIAAARSDFSSAEHAYEALISSPAEAQILTRLKRHALDLEEPLAKAIELSRQNRNEEARATLVASEAQFAAVEADLDDLIRVNHVEAHEALARMANLQHTSSSIFTALLALGALSILSVGVVTIRMVRDREEDICRHAAMLETRNRDLDAFAGRVAHDLRGPLGTVKTNAFILERRIPAEQATTVLQRAVQQMEAIIEDLLALSRMEAGAKQGRADPARVVEQVRDAFASRLESQQGLLRVRVASAQVQCVEGLLRQVLWNLVDNSLKYRRPEVPPDIEISGSAAAQQYELQVADNGFGMSDDELRKAFDPFYRAHRVPGQKGTGLGLSIVRRIVEASGGQISAESSIGKGTTFRIHFALAPEPATGRSG